MFSNITAYLTRLLVLIFLLPSVCLSEEKLLVGVIVPLSGPLAEYGNNIKLGLELAKSELRPEQSAQIELVFEDDQYQATKAIAAYRKLTTTGKSPKAIITFGSTIGNALAPMAEKDQRVLFAIGASDKAVTKNRKHVFTHWVSPESEARAMYQEIIRRGYKSVAVVRAENDGLNAIADAFVARLMEAGLSSAVEEQISVLPDATDFRSSILKIKQKNVSAVATMLFPKQIAIFAKQMREMGMSSPIFGADSMEDSDVLAHSSGALLNAWYAIGVSGTPAFHARFENYYGYHVKALSANAFDSLNLVFQAWKSKAETLAMSEYLANVKNYSGACGIYSSTKDNGFDLPAQIKVITEGGFEILDINKK